MLLAAIVVGAFFQSINARFIAVSCFVFTAALHGAIAQLPFMDSGLYYISAGGSNLLAVYILHRINHVSQIIIDLQIVCVVAFALNFYGFVIYMAYLPMDSYKQIFPAVYVLVLIALFRKDDGNVVGDANGFGFLGGDLRVLFAWFARIQLPQKDGG